jgi:hypothetical protein
MSRKWAGGLIRPTPITPTGPLAAGTAPGIWTIDQVAYWLRQGVWPIAGNILAIEDVFSTWLYTGNGGTQTITNGIDLSGRGGLVWSKCRSSTLAGNGIHTWIDTVRGAGFRLSSELSGAQVFNSNTITAFNSNGFSIGNSPINNTSAETFASWTFREQAKFFDIVTYAGNGANRTIAHNLGSVPGCIIVKRTDTTADWQVYHRSMGQTRYAVLNSTAAQQVDAARWNNTAPTDTVFSLGTDATVNASGGTYVAYLFAHDAGGFGATGADNVISCGSYTGNGALAGQAVTLGYEPQWLLIKPTFGASGNWNLIDNMRGFTAGTVGAGDAVLNPNLSNAESTGTFVAPTATGFQIETGNVAYNSSGATYIYIAIRRGPMRTPTTGTSVLQLTTAIIFDASSTWLSSGVSPGGRLGTERSALDLSIVKASNQTDNWAWTPRLTGYSSSSSTISPSLASNSNAGEVAQTGGVRGATATASTDLAFKCVFNSAASANFLLYNFSRAPGFFDVVCYTGNGTTQNQSHNLGVVPELIIVKIRSVARDWAVYFGNNGRAMALNSSASDRAFAGWNFTTPTSSVFSLGADSDVNANGSTYVAYLFASCPGVSKVGSYTGTGATQVVNCGFAAGARFVLIKRTDSTGDWYVWDSGRGIVAGNDPYWLLNSTAAQVTGTDWVDTAASGFELSNAAGNNVNINTASYIFLAIS